MKTLIVQMKCKLGEAYKVAAFVVDNVNECQIYSISGAYDLLAIINLDDDIDPGVFVNTRLHSVPGIVDTNTMIAFNAFTPSPLPVVAGAPRPRCFRSGRPAGPAAR